jgi:long-chain acyl-CoA synthetase
MPDNQARPDTFPRLLLANAERLRGRPAMREKDLGIWQTWTWDEVATEVRMLACGLAALGFKRGDTLAIIGDNRPRLYWAMAAAQALGGVPVPLYQDAIASEMVYVFEDAAARFAIVEDQEQVDKLLEILPRCPLLEHIVYDDTRGMRHYHQPQLQSYDALTEQGRAFDAAQPDYYAQQIAQGRASDVGIMLYTSGTTGKPKGVCQTHHAFIVSAQGGVGFDRLGPDDSMLSYLPMAWVGDHLFSYAQWLVAGFTINCPESGETVMTDLKEIGPTYYFAPPRVFENLLTTVMIRMEDASAGQARAVRVFHRCRAPVRRRSARRQAGRAARPAALRDRQSFDLRPAAQRAWHEPHPRRLYRGGCNRPRSIPFLPLDRRQSQAVVRLDRNLRLCLPAAGRRSELRHRRQARARRRSAHRGQR